MLKMTPILTFCKIIKELTVNEINFLFIILKYQINIIFNSIFVLIRYIIISKFNYFRGSLWQLYSTIISL